MAVRQKSSKVVNSRTIWQRAGLVFGASLFVFYVGWNVYWITQYRIPPSMLKGLSGLPAPTTGGTRSLLALANGAVLESLYFNPMTLPFVGLLLFTVAQAAKRGSANRTVFSAWIWLLSIAWVIKLMSPQETW